MSNVARRRSVTVTASKTVADNESGLVQNITRDALTITLPAAAAGKRVLLRLAGVPKGANASGPVGSGDNASQGLTVVGSVTGLGATGALTATKANMVAGDEIELISGGATWYVGHVEGTSWVVA